MNVNELEQKILNYSNTVNLRDLMKNGLLDEEYVIFDTETTGFGGIEGEIIDLGAIIVKNGEIKHKDGNFYPLEHYLRTDINDMDMFGCLIVPKSGKIPAEITEITHIDMNTINEGLQPGMKAPHKTELTFADAFIKFMKYVDGRIFVAHNAAFDRRIIKENVYNNLEELLQKTSIEDISNFFDNYNLDTLVEAQNVLKLNPVENYKNSVLAEYYGYESNSQMLHRAFYDSVFTAGVFFGLMNDFITQMEIMDNISEN